MKTCKLFETLNMCNTNLDNEHKLNSYSCSEECPWFGKCFYDVKCPPDDAKLQEYFGGWQKYCVYNMKSHKCNLGGTSYIIVNILHLINPFKVDDIVIFRILKKNKDDDKYVIRYVCKQGNTSNIIGNIKQLNDHISKKCNYSGRLLTTSDFKINNDVSETEEVEDNKLPL
jgi:hypothetical protein